MVEKFAVSDLVLWSDTQLATCPKNKKGLYRLSFQNTVCADVENGVLSVEHAQILLESRGCYGPKGKAALKAAAAKITE